jgi:hypothetical protein
MTSCGGIPAVDMPMGIVAPAGVLKKKKKKDEIKAQAESLVVALLDS